MATTYPVLRWQIGDVPAEIELHAAKAQLALYAGEWEEVKRSSDASAELSEREGLIGKLCLPYTLRGRLHWRSGQWQDSERAFRRAHELAEQIGWSEVCFDALYGLSTTLRDEGDLQGAETALSQALDVCERAGLIVQSIQANSARALLSGMAGRDAVSRRAARADGRYRRGHAQEAFTSTGVSSGGSHKRIQGRECAAGSPPVTLRSQYCDRPLVTLRAGRRMC